MSRKEHTKYCTNRPASKQAPGSAAYCKMPELVRHINKKESSPSCSHRVAEGAEGAESRLECQRKRFREAADGKADVVVSWPSSVFRGVGEDADGDAGPHSAVPLASHMMIKDAVYGFMPIAAAAPAKLEPICSRDAQHRSVMQRQHFDLNRLLILGGPCNRDVPEPLARSPPLPDGGAGNPSLERLSGERT